LLVAVGAATTRSSGTTWFLPQARAWELLAGCALGALPPRLTRPLSGRAAAPAGWAGLLMLVAVLALADALGGLVTGPLMVMESMLCCAAALLMVQAASVHGTSWSTAMGWRPLTWVGRRSYGLYLYHVPIAATRGAPLGRRIGRGFVPLGRGAGRARCSAAHEPVRRPPDGSRHPLRAEGPAGSSFP
jgi:peptidoglycan/LPS O-acetylase OafA/YrhL